MHLDDNLQSAVLERRGEAIRGHPTRLALAAHDRFEPRPVAVARGTEKGRVERAIRAVRAAFFAAPAWRDLDDLDAQAAAWCRGPAADRPCPEERTLAVREAFAQAQPRLLALPDNPFPSDERAAVTVGKTPSVRFDPNDDSLPHTPVQRLATVVASPQEVRVLDGAAVLACHPRRAPPPRAGSPGPGRPRQPRPARRPSNAHLGRFQPPADFDWQWPTQCERAAIEESMGLHFLRAAAHAIRVGPNGAGKSMAARNIAYRAVRAGHTVPFASAARTLNEPAGADGDSALRHRLAVDARPRLLVVDEGGYLSYSNRHADLLCEIVSRRYGSKSTPIATDRPQCRMGRGLAQRRWRRLPGRAPRPPCRDRRHPRRVLPSRRGEETRRAAPADSPGYRPNPLASKPRHPTGAPA